MVIPIRKIQASELKELVVWWSKQGRGVDPKKLMRVRLEGGGGGAGRGAEHFLRELNMVKGLGLTTARSTMYSVITEKMDL